MPIYDYKCNKIINEKTKTECGKIIKDVYLKLSTTIPKLKCEKCGNEDFKKFEKTISSGISTIFKGPGWETNDNYNAKSPHKNMDPSDVQGGGKVEKPSGFDGVLHKRDIGKKRYKG